MNIQLIRAKKEDAVLVHRLQVAAEYNRDKVLQIASYAHSYVFEVKNEIIACGSISSFWGSETESILLTIFVKPELHGMGVGRKIIETLESDELFRRATRVEIPASITGTEFYIKFPFKKNHKYAIIYIVKVLKNYLEVF